MSLTFDLQTPKTTDDSVEPFENLVVDQHAEDRLQKIEKLLEQYPRRGFDLSITGRFELPDLPNDSPDVTITKEEEGGFSIASYSSQKAELPDGSEESVLTVKTVDVDNKGYVKGANVFKGYAGMPISQTFLDTSNYSILSEYVDDLLDQITATYPIAN